jgi:SAM-dependent methyltransferase
LSLRFHEISESNHHILNPLTHEKLMLLGEICQLHPEIRQLDLACGKAEMLCQWSHRWGIHGTGVDVSAVFLAAARERARELNVSEKITLIEADAGKQLDSANSFDIVSCIGASWIGGGLVGTLKLLLPALKKGGLLLAGEPYWIKEPSDKMMQKMGVGTDDFSSLLGTFERIESAGLELVEMVLADADTWDRYVAGQWFTVDSWLRANQNDPDAAEIKAWIAQSKRAYLEFQREYFGWGVFVLREK